MPTKNEKTAARRILAALRDNADIAEGTNQKRAWRAMTKVARDAMAFDEQAQEALSGPDIRTEDIRDLWDLWSDTVFGVEEDIENEDERAAFLLMREVALTNVEGCLHARLSFDSECDKP